MVRWYVCARVRNIGRAPPSKQGLNVPQSYKTFESAPPVNTNMIVSDEAVFPTSTCNDSDYEVISDTGKATTGIIKALILPINKYIIIVTKTNAMNKVL